MIGIIQSELLKIHHTFFIKLIILAPLVTLLLGYLLSGSHVQLSTYNWWYFMILPLVVSLCSASMIAREKKSGMQNIVSLPIRFDKIWLGKTAALVILLFVTNLFLYIFCGPALPGFSHGIICECLLNLFSIYSLSLLCLLLLFHLPMLHYKHIFSKSQSIQHIFCCFYVVFMLLLTCDKVGFRS